jgi:Flp pilus assembly protein TadD
VTGILSIVSRIRGLDAALAEHAKLRSVRPASDFKPSQLNSLGYSLLTENRVDDAIRVFRLNVELYPGDSNAYDSLGEAYMAGGRNELAIVSYKKSLQLDPNNENAVAMLKKMGAEGRP